MHRFDGHVHDCLLAIVIIVPFYTVYSPLSINLGPPVIIWLFIFSGRRRLLRLTFGPWTIVTRLDCDNSRVFRVE